MESRLMNTELPCRSIFLTSTNPYYIYTPGYNHKSAGIRVLHELCSLLNKLGHEAYVISPPTSGDLWTPVLTDAIKVAHYKSGKKPIVVYPEVVKGQPLQLGLPVRYVLNYPGLLGGDTVYSANELIYTFWKTFYPSAKILNLPTIDLSLIDKLKKPESARSGIAFYHNRYTLKGGKVRDFGASAIEISRDKPETHEETLAILAKVERLYSYESSGIVLEAVLSGCPVILLPNPITLPSRPDVLSESGDDGIAWGEDPEEIQRAYQTVKDARPNYEQRHRAWPQQINDFIRETQAAAKDLDFSSAWPQDIVDTLHLPNLTEKEKAERFDRIKLRRLQHQYEAWLTKSTPQEIDAQIYAEHWIKNTTQKLTVVIDHQKLPDDLLADTLDSISNCLGEPERLIIISDTNPPFSLENTNIAWININKDIHSNNTLRNIQTNWILAIRAGTKLLPRALMEFGLAPNAWPNAELIYADEAYLNPNKQITTPHFKPHANIELLRSTNYLGSAVLLTSKTWIKHNYPTFHNGGIYKLGLTYVEEKQQKRLGHIDTVLYTATPVSTPLDESIEFQTANQYLSSKGIAQRIKPSNQYGCWTIEYSPPTNASVSVVIPTGSQTGYLRSLIDSINKKGLHDIKEVIVICSLNHHDEVKLALNDVANPSLIKIVINDDAQYAHGAALNKGIEHAKGEYILVCDDDTEIIHSNWLPPLIAIAAQNDVACVSPRLVSNRNNETIVVGGPLVLGINGTYASYNGEGQHLDEVGVFSRLQLTQDVSAVAGHFFLFKKKYWSELRGFDEITLKNYHTVLDFCLRLNSTGLRHVWTPLVSVMHHGGKTLQQLKRNPKSAMKILEDEISEREELLKKWPTELANDHSYNRHLSLLKPYDIETDIVIDWQPTRKDRPRAVAVPLRSGAGQYRVIDPLHALQERGLMQSCIVSPPENGVTRVLQPLELVRAQPDRLILQHSVDDGHLNLADQYKKVLPELKIIQMVDDLLGYVPEKHPFREYQIREGHQRMVAALQKSDSIIVTTEPLKRQYEKYNPSIKIVPNSLTEKWTNLRSSAPRHTRLRIGWVGAGQHRGDLEMIADVVKELSTEVDWVFMGMAPETIQPYISEFHPFVSISEYPKKMSTLDLDIAVAPLEDNLFNECKSNLRLLEYGAMGWPVVCSDVFPYRTGSPPVIRCKNDPDDWLKSIRELINNQSLREELGNKLHEWVMKNFQMKDFVELWYHSLLD